MTSFFVSGVMIRHLVKAQVSIALFGLISTASAQAPGTLGQSGRSYGGWQAASNTAATPLSTIGSPDSPYTTRMVQQAGFQAPLPTYGGDPRGVVPPGGSIPPAVLPPNMNAVSNQFANPGGIPMPATDVGSATSGLRPIESQPRVIPAAMANQPPMGSSGLRERSTPTNVYPPNAYSAAPQQPPIATGYPYVSPAPGTRTGNYPTSPYQGVFRQASYQMPVAQPAPTIPTQPAPGTISATGLAPQYNPTTGVYPTGVYPTSYQNNCATLQPGIPSMGAVPGVVPGAVAPPTYPPNLAPTLYSQNNSGYRPLFSLGQENYNVQLGRGMIGQPTVYVQGQPIRNFLRYISP